MRTLGEFAAASARAFTSRRAPARRKFGKCSHCGEPEGKLIKAPGAVANPGGAGGCPKGGKHMFQFAKCKKCGASEI